MAIIKKITVKTVCGTIPRKELPDHGEKVELMEVYGQAHRFQAGETEFGPYVKFKGSFEAVNIKDGAVYRSPNLILPDVASDMLEAALMADGVTSADFALKIGVMGDDTAATGYVYYADTLLQPSETDPLEAIRNQISEQKQLAAPEEKKSATTKKTGNDAKAETA